MPIGKPTEDGEIVTGSRHYKGRTLGAATTWKCPSCGKQNEGRTPEQGCAICGAGDPTKSKAGGTEPAETAAPPPPVTPRQHVDRQGGARDGGSPPAPRLESRPPVVRVLRLIEYVIRQDSGVSYNTVLRNSLVGTMDMGWGTLTATIVDSADLRQEDLLNHARRQPGVWLANPEAMASQDGAAREMVRSILEYRRQPRAPEFLTALRQEVDRQRMAEPPIPDTGPAYSAEQDLLADAIIQACGLQLANTIALALSQIAPELEANAESEMFISADEALQLANAIMQKMPATLHIPTVREGEDPGRPEPPPPAPAPTDTRVKGIVERMQEASRPTAVFREPPPQEEP